MTSQISFFSHNLILNNARPHMENRHFLCNSIVVLLTHLENYLFLSGKETLQEKD